MVKLAVFVLLPERVWCGWEFSTCKLLCASSVSKLVELELVEAKEFVGVGGTAWCIWCKGNGKACDREVLDWVGNVVGLGCWVWVIRTS